MKCDAFCCHGLERTTPRVIRKACYTSDILVVVPTVGKFVMSMTQYNIMQASNIYQ